MKTGKAAIRAALEEGGIDAMLAMYVQIGAVLFAMKLPKEHILEGVRLSEEMAKEMKLERVQ